MPTLYRQFPPAFFILVVSFLTILFIPPKSYAADYPMLGGDAGRTGFVNENGPKEAKQYWVFSFDDLKKVLNRQIIGENAGQAVIRNNQVFVSTEAGILSLDLKSRKPNWISQSLALGSIAADNENIYVTGSQSGKITALSQKDGKKIWSASTNKPMSHSLPLVVERYLLVGDDSGTLYNFDTKSGQKIWSKKLGEVIHSSPSFGDGLVFVGTEDDNSSVFALKIETGETVWEFPIDKIGQRGSGKLNLFHATPAYSNGVVYIGGENGYFYAISASDGKLIWKKDFDGWFTSAPAVDEKNIYIGNWNGYFYAISKHSGEVVWKYFLEKDRPFDFIDSPRGEKQKQGPNTWPIVTKDKVFTGSSNGFFYAFDKKTGQVLWKELYGHSWPILANEILLIPNLPPQDALKGEMIVAISDQSPALVISPFLIKPEGGFGIKNVALILGGGVVVILIGFGIFYLFRKIHKYGANIHKLD